MAQQVRLHYLIAFVLYMSLLGSHVQALQLVRNGVPYRARDELQFIASNVSIETPDGLEIDPNAPPTRVNVPIEVEIKKEEDMAGSVATNKNRSMDQILAAKNVTDTKASKAKDPATPTKPSSIPPTKPATTKPLTTPSIGKAQVGKGDANKGNSDSTSSSVKPETSTTKRSSANGLYNAHPMVAIFLSLGLAIFIANKMFFI